MVIDAPTDMPTINKRSTHIVGCALQFLLFHNHNHPALLPPPTTNAVQVIEALQTILDTQPAAGAGAGGGSTKEAAADHMAEDLLSKVGRFGWVFTISQAWHTQF